MSFNKMKVSLDIIYSIAQFGPVDEALLNCLDLERKNAALIAQHKCPLWALIQNYKNANNLVKKVENDFKVHFKWTAPALRALFELQCWPILYLAPIHMLDTMDIMAAVMKVAPDAKSAFRLLQRLEEWASVPIGTFVDTLALTSFLKEHYMPPCDKMNVENWLASSRLEIFDQRAGNIYKRMIDGTLLIVRTANEYAMPFHCQTIEQMRQLIIDERRCLKWPDNSTRNYFEDMRPYNDMLLTGEPQIESSRYMFFFCRQLLLRGYFDLCRHLAGNIWEKLIKSTDQCEVIQIMMKQNYPEWFLLSIIEKCPRNTLTVISCL